MQRIYFIFLLGFLLGTLPNFSQEKKVTFMVAKDTLKKYKEINPLSPAKVHWFMGEFELDCIITISTVINTTVIVMPTKDDWQVIAMTIINI